MSAAHQRLLPGVKPTHDRASQELPRVLQELRAALRPQGVLLTSNPRGGHEEGWSGDRSGAYHDLERWSDFLLGAGFEAIRHYYRPEGLPLAQQPWLASLWRRGAAPGAAHSSSK